jgi:acyl phosphate:glycerol-3-phosphate acyltransferase
MIALTRIILCVALAYLLGAIPFGYLISRLKGVDIRRVGSGNIGATNVFRCIGKSWGILTFICDALKGFAAAFLLPRAAGFCCEDPLFAAVSVLCAFSAVLGHNWPVFLGFKGGKGVATSAGALAGIAPLAVAIGFGVWVLAFLSTRYVSVASMTSAVVVAAAGWLLYRDHGLPIPIMLTVLGCLGIWRHRTNIQRLIEGRENRFQFRRRSEK